METIKNVDEKELRQLIQDVALIKEILSINKRDPEGELSDWAKKELEKARNRKIKISHEEVKKRLLKR